MPLIHSFHRGSYHTCMIRSHCSPLPTTSFFKTTECHQHCASKCSHEAKKIASNKKKYCEDYGPDAPPLAPHHVCSEMNQCDECQGDCNSGEKSLVAGFVFIHDRLLARGMGALPVHDLTMTDIPEYIYMYLCYEFYRRRLLRRSKVFPKGWRKPDRWRPWMFWRRTTEGRLLLRSWQDWRR